MNASDWISVEERLPEDDLTPVMVRSFCDFDEQLFVAWLGADTGRETYWIMDQPMWAGEDIEIPGVTHWMPLPSPPAL